MESWRSGRPSRTAYPGMDELPGDEISYPAAGRLPGDGGYQEMEVTRGWLPGDGLARGCRLSVESSGDAAMPNRAPPPPPRLTRGWIPRRPPAPPPGRSPGGPGGRRPRGLGARRRGTPEAFGSQRSPRPRPPAPEAPLLWFLRPPIARVFASNASGANLSPASPPVGRENFQIAPPPSKGHVRIAGSGATGPSPRQPSPGNVGHGRIR